MLASDALCFDSTNTPYKLSIACVRTSYYCLAADSSAGRLNAAPKVRHFTCTVTRTCTVLNELLYIHVCSVTVNITPSAMWKGWWAWFMLLRFHCESLVAFEIAFTGELLVTEPLTKYVLPCVRRRLLYQGNADLGIRYCTLGAKL